MPATRPSNADSRSRRQILELLKRYGPQDAVSLAAEQGISAMAVRQHLYALRHEKLVTYVQQPRPVGRPAKLWQLTEAAQRLFPDAHATLCVELVEALGETFGKRGLEKLVAARRRQQLQQYARQIPKRASLSRRLNRLAEIRSAEGYMAEVLKDDDGAWLLVENHCPICAAATACTGLCAAELEVFQAVLGEGVEIERTEHILEGARRCAYRVRRKPRRRKK